MGASSSASLAGEALFGTALRSFPLSPHDLKPLLHKDRDRTNRDPLLTIAPSREDLVVPVECVYSWSLLSFVLGHALCMKAIHGAKAKSDRIDGETIAVFVRGGLIGDYVVREAEATYLLKLSGVHVALSGP